MYLTHNLLIKFKISVLFIKKYTRGLRVGQSDLFTLRGWGPPARLAQVYPA
jgi:hypothetical protein